MTDRDGVTALDAGREYGALAKDVRAGERLEARLEAGGWRHYLQGRPVSCGASLQVMTSAGWLGVRYEAALWRDLAAPEATLYFGFQTGELEPQLREDYDGDEYWGDPQPWATATVDHQERMLFRWPPR